MFFEVTVAETRIPVELLRDNHGIMYGTITDSIILPTPPAYIKPPHRCTPCAYLRVLYLIAKVIHIPRCILWYIRRHCIHTACSTHREILLQQQRQKKSMDQRCEILSSARTPHTALYLFRHNGNVYIVVHLQSTCAPY